MSTSQLYYHSGGTGRWSARLRRDDESPVPLTDIKSASIIFRDSVSGVVVNKRGEIAENGTITRQDVIDGDSHEGKNGFQFEEVTDDAGNYTQIGWDLDVADIGILSTLRAREEHYADLLISYQSGSVVKVIDHSISVIAVAPRRLMCSYEDVAGTPGFAGYLADPGEEAIESSEKIVRPKIETLIALAQERMEAYAGRFFMRSSEAEPAVQYHTVPRGERVLYLDRWPVKKVIDLAEDWSGKFEPLSTELIDAEQYDLDAESGVIEYRWRQPVPGVRSIRTRTVAGIFDDIGQVPMDLRESCAQQAAYDWQRRQQLGLTGVGVAGSSIMLSATQDLLDNVKKLLERKYMRVEL